ncbi:MAG: hypothetical protein ACP5IL_16755 [Syntrophobacteraceae bacterium]
MAINGGQRCAFVHPTTLGKMGIGRPKHGEPVEDFVLLPPYSEERQAWKDMLAQAEEALRSVLATGITEAMNRFNRRD